MRYAGNRHGLRGTLAATMLIVVSPLSRAADFSPADAVRDHDQRKVQAAPNEHADVKARAGDGSTSLLWAAHWELRGVFNS